MQNNAVETVPANVGSNGLVKLNGEAKYVNVWQNKASFDITAPVNLREFRELTGLGNAEARRKYREFLGRFGTAANMAYTGLTSDGAHVCKRVRQTRHGAVFYVGELPKATAARKEGQVRATVRKEVSAEIVAKITANGKTLGLSDEQIAAVIANIANK